VSQRVGQNQKESKKKERKKKENIDLRHTISGALSVTLISGLAARGSWWNIVQ
jgi:hypothetical protein